MPPAVCLPTRRTVVVRHVACALLLFRNSGYWVVQPSSSTPLIAVLLLLAGLNAPAHEEPRGDVRPRVLVSEGRFEIYFANNAETEHTYESKAGRWFDPWMNVYRTVITADGNVIAERKAIENPKTPIPDRRWSWNDPRYVGEEGFLHIWEKERRIYLARFRPVSNRSDAGSPEDGIEHIEDVLWTDRTAWVVLAPPPAGGSTYDPYPFYFEIIDRKTGKNRRVAIGKPCRIYYFPVASALVRLGDWVYLAWIRELPAGFVDVPVEGGEVARMEAVRYELILTRIHTTDSKVSHSIVSAPGSSNVSLSMAGQQGRLLVAHHAGGRIHWRLLNPGELEFTPQLEDQPAAAP